jgi:hypothetical protein
VLLLSFLKIGSLTWIAVQPRETTGMARNADYSGLAELEREIELEMDEELDTELDEEMDEGELGSDEENEALLELNEEAGPDEELESEDPEGEAPNGGRDSEFVDRFMEIASREFESESEVDRAMNETLNDVASEYLFGSIIKGIKKAKKFGQRLAKNSIVKSLVKKGLSVASGQFPALKAAMQLAKGNLQGALVNLGKQALGAAIPGGTAALGALQSIGIAPAGEMANDREAWENYVQISREAFEHLGNNVTAKADQPIEASRLASQALQHALGRAQARVASGVSGVVGGIVGGGTRAGGTRGTGQRSGRVTRYHIRPGEKIVIVGGRKLIVSGG